MTFPYCRPAIYLLAFILITSVACNKDDDDDMEMTATTEELLIGTWTTFNVEITTMIGDQSVADYLVTEEGLSPAEAIIQEELLVSYLASELSVTLTLKEDHTYESFHQGGMDSGTWSLGADDMTLTLIEGGEEIIFTVNEITTTRMTATIADQIQYDIDNDGNTPDVTIDAEAVLTLVK